MKLKTSLTASRDGSMVDATDENLIHDAAAVHALMMAMDSILGAGPYKVVRDDIKRRADKLMRSWGFDTGEDV